MFDSLSKFPEGVLGRLADRGLQRSLLLVAVVLGIYLPFLGAPFYFDDFHHIVDNPAIRDLDRLFHPFQDATTFSVRGDAMAVYRPLLMLSLKASYAAFGMASWGYRLVNVALLAGSGLLVFLFVRSASRRRDRLLGLVAAMLFLVHPGQTQSVMYVNSRSELLAFFFVLLGMVTIQAATEGPPDQGTRPGGRKRRGLLLLVACGSMLLALLSKESGVLLLGWAGLWVLVGLRDGWRRAVQPGAVMLALASTAALWLFLRREAGAAAIALPRSASDPAGLSPAEILERIQSVWPYMHRLLWPAPLRLFHELPDAGQQPSTLALLSVIALLALIVLALIALLRRHTQAFLLFAWPLVALVPYFVPELNLRVNENRMHPLLLVVPLLLLALERVGGADFRRRLVAIASIVAMVWSVQAITRARQWMDWEEFYRAEIRHAPGLAHPRSQLAFRLRNDGRESEARSLLEQSLHLRGGNDAIVYSNLGLDLVEEGKTEEALHYLSMAVETDPDAPVHRSNLGSALSLLGRKEAARREFEAALEGQPCYEKALMNLGVLEEERGRLQEAAALYRTALACRPDYPKGQLALGRTLISTGDTAEASKHLEAALESEELRDFVSYQSARLKWLTGREAEAREILHDLLDRGRVTPQDLRDAAEFGDWPGAP
jgi:tetratricopeptide (TPR) repeat protein